MKRTLLMLIVCLLLTAVLVSWSLFLRDEPAVPTVVTNGPDAALVAALAQRARLDADGESLKQVLIELEKAYGIDVVADRKALADEGLEYVLSAEVHCHVSDISLGSLMRVLLHQIDRDVTAVPRGSRIMLTTATAVEEPSQLVGRVYPLPPELLGPTGVDEETLAELITGSCDPASWEEVGGFGVMKTLPGAMAVVQRQEVQAEIADLLDTLVRMQADPSDLTPVYVGRAAHANCESIRRAMEKVTAVHFEDVPLRTVLSRLAHEHGIPIFIDQLALIDVGMGTDVRISADLWKVRLGSALNHILLPLDLTWYVSDEVLWVTTMEEAEEYLVIRLYPVGDLLAPWTGVDADTLYDTINSSIVPTTWDVVGGPATTELCGNVLVVAQTDDAHPMIERLLGDIRQLLDPSAPAPPPTVADTLRARLEQALESPAYLRCEDKPLGQVLEWLREQHGIDLRVDRKALDAVGLGLDTPVTCDMADEPLRRVLAIVLRPLDLEFAMRNDVVLVTTVEEAESWLRTRVYDVRHLIDPALELPRDDEQSGGGHWFGEPDYDTVINLITMTIAPATWDDVGGPSSIYGIAGGLIISQTDDVHRQVEALLAGLTQLQNEPGRVAPLEAESPENRIPPAITETFGRCWPGYVRIYPLAGFPWGDDEASGFDSRGFPVGDGQESLSESLVEVIYDCIEPDSWDEVGGSGSITVFDGPLGDGLVVSNTYRVHRQVESLLARLRGPLPEEGGPGQLLADSPARQAVDETRATEIRETRLYNVRGLHGRFPAVRERDEPTRMSTGGRRVLVDSFDPADWRRRAFEQNIKFEDLVRLFGDVPSDGSDAIKTDVALLGDVMVVAGSRDAHRRLERFITTVRQILADVPAPDGLADGFDAPEIEQLRQLLEPDRPAAAQACAVYWIAGGKEPPVELVDPIAGLLSTDNSIESQRLRPLVFFALRKFGPAASRAAKAVAAQWEFAKTDTQQSRLIATLGRLGPDAVEPLTALLDDPYSLTLPLKAVYTALGNLGEDAAAAIPTLLERLSFDVEDDKNVLRTLEGIDPQAEKIRRIVAEQMNDPDPKTRDRGFKLHEYVRTHFGDPLP